MEPVTEYYDQLICVSWNKIAQKQICEMEKILENEKLEGRSLI